MTRTHHTELRLMRYTQIRQHRSILRVVSTTLILKCKNIDLTFGNSNLEPSIWITWIETNQLTLIKVWADSACCRTRFLASRINCSNPKRRSPNPLISFICGHSALRISSFISCLSLSNISSSNCKQTLWLNHFKRHMDKFQDHHCFSKNISNHSCYIV